MRVYKWSHSYASAYGVDITVTLWLIIFCVSHFDLNSVIDMLGTS